jgi:thymidine phosphorylase
MHQPLGCAAGNALEVAEALAFLQSAEDRDPRLLAVTLALAGELLALGGLASDPPEGRAKAAARLADGSAREIFARMVTALGGPADFADRPVDYLPKAAICRPCPAPRAGFIRRMDTRRIGLAVLALGGGRRDATAAIDPAVGLSGIRGLGQEIHLGEALALVHAADEASCAAAIAALQGAVEIGDKAPPKSPILRERIHSRHHAETP